MKEQGSEKKIRQMLCKTDETLREIQLVGDMRREEIQSAQDDVTQKIQSHNLALQENEAYQSAYRRKKHKDILSLHLTGLKEILTGYRTQGKENLIS